MNYFECWDFRVRDLYLSSGLSPTQYQYTGQYSHTADFGLMYYNARWYDPALGRFAQADSIVPPGVQGLDRYAYVNNNPVKYIDPSGNTVDCPAWDSACDLTKAPSPETILKKYHATFSKGWAENHKWAVVHGVIRTAYRFARELGTGITATNAFRTVYGLNDGDPFFFEWDENCWGCRADPTGCDAGITKGVACVPGFGYTNTENWVEFASMSGVEVPLRNINNVIHELGHAFDLRLGRIPENTLAVNQDLLRNDVGFYGDPSNRTWEASSGTNGSETFADQFLGWVYSKWDGNDGFGPARAGFMNQMNGLNGWVAQAAGLP